MASKVRIPPSELVYVPPTPGDEIVISGISGRFPESKNAMELHENLLNKKDVITSNYERWKLDHPEIPRDGGKIYDITKFDSIFFGVHYKQAHTMDPMGRMLIEHAYEAIVDAGFNPRQLRGSNTGVIIGSCYSEAEKTWFYEKLQANGFGITGCSKAMLANRISYALDLRGPSFSMDSACSSSMLALDQAYRMMQNGTCDSFIVGGVNLCLHPYVTLQFARLGVLSLDARCKSFDAKANGYVRSEACSVLFLQRAKNAKRIYASIVYTKSNCDGYKEEGITYPASEVQRRLLEQFYEDCKMSPSCLSYLEAHGTGTSVGDPEELRAISKVFLEGRKTPLLIGSVKSNIGHTEPASGICSIVKIILGMEHGVILPNMHFSNPTRGIEALEDGRIVVVADPMPWEGGYAGANSFGFGGANAHVLLKSNPKKKPENKGPNDDLPRIVVVSGRTEEGVQNFIHSIEKMPMDVEFIRLLHDIHAETIPNNLYRAYTIVGSKVSETPTSEVQMYPGVKRPVWFVFSGMGSQWAGMGEALMRFPVFAKAIYKCDAVLKPHGVDIFDIITNKDKKTFDNILNSFVGIAAIQVGLVDLLTLVGIVPDNIIGHSVGELGCAYADGCFTAEQMVLAAYSRGLASIETKMIYGSMAAVGLGYDDVKDLCPPDIEVACHNGPDSSTISGPAESMKQFVTKLQSDGIFAKEVPCSNIAYHSRYIAEAGPKLLAYLKKVIPDPKPRSPKWLSTSVPRNKWSSPEAQFSSAEYHTNNLLNSVLFAETATMIPRNAITIEIAPHGLLQAILRRSLDSNVVNVALTKRGHKDNAEVFLQGLGKLFNVGLDPQLANLYPDIEFPVSTGTPMISPYITWEHTHDWYVPSYSQQKKITTGERLVDIELNDEVHEYVAHHVIDGRNLYPATGYLVLVWETLAMMAGHLFLQTSVVFENVRFERATNVPQNGTIQLIVMIQKGTGRFEIVEGTTAVVTGMIRATVNPVQEKLPPGIVKLRDDEEVLNSKDIYKELKLRGYEYTGPFRSLKSASVNGCNGHIGWQGNWTTFTDNMLQLNLLATDTRGLFVPTRILKMVIDTKLHQDMIRDMPEDDLKFPAYVDKKHDVIISGGVEIRGLRANAIFRRKNMATAVTEEYKFVANRDQAETPLEHMIVLCINIALDNRQLSSPKIIELITEDDNVTVGQLLAPIFISVLGNLPIIQPNVILATGADRFDTSSFPANITVVDPMKIPEDATTYIAAGYDLLGKRKTNYIDQLTLSLMDDGHIFTVENRPLDKDTSLYVQKCGLNIILEKKWNNKTLLLLKKQMKPVEKTEVVFLDNHEFTWLQTIQDIVKAEEEKETNETLRVIVVGQGDPDNGALGFAKCVRKEPYADMVRCVMIQDENAPKFSLDNPLYSNQLELDVAYNVLRPGNIWGTYRHLPLPKETLVLTHHAYLHQMTRGDLNSLEWVTGYIPKDEKPEKLIYISYAALNFKDIMLTTGKLAAEVVSRTRREAEDLIGMEYSGVHSDGRRVMGILENKGISNMAYKYGDLHWYVPDSWTLEDAATVPCAYATACYALYMKAKIKRGEKILIHAGSGAVGQAAINYALFEGCEIFTTVGTPEKRRFIREHYPSIPDDHIGNSRDTSFEQMVLEQTNGEGVDIVLNSLAEEKLLASVRCLRDRGRFLEIGKFDLAADNQIGMEIFLKEIAFYGVMLDTGMYRSKEYQSKLYKVFQKSLDSGAVKPLVRTCFPKEEVETAFRYMAAGKHIGKVLIKVRDENAPINSTILAYPRFFAKPTKSYVLIGGLGGLGLEITDWLILRGAQNVVLVSRNGITNGYQRMRTELWKSYGVNVLIISGLDLSKTNDCEFVLKSAEKLAPVAGIFNLAAVLKDCLLVNQTQQTFEESLTPKVLITKRLDEVSRKVCPQLEHFVVFSSITCGRGTAGQTNYGMGNSVMERICERRVEEGLPGLAIEWGAVADVGLAAAMKENDKELVIGGTLPQKIPSCLEEFDKFLTQSRPIVVSMVVAEKRAAAGGVDNILDAVLNIMSLRDIKGISHVTSLSDLGMDSMMAVEIKQTLERDFEVFLTPQEIRNLNLAKLIEMSEIDQNKHKKAVKIKKKTEVLSGLKLLVRSLHPEVVNSEICVDVPVTSLERKMRVYLIPGIEGAASVFAPFVSKIKHPTTYLQIGTKHPEMSVTEIADLFLPCVLEKNEGRKDFIILGYSYGSLIAIELVRKLEALGFYGRCILVDGSPDFMKAMREQHFVTESDEDLQMKLLIEIISVMRFSFNAELISALQKCTSWEERLETLVSFAPEDIQKVYPIASQKAICTALYKRICTVPAYSSITRVPIKTPIVLLKPSIASVVCPDYGLQKVTMGRVDTYEVEGDHLTILESEKIAAIINGIPIDNEDLFKEEENTTTQNMIVLDAPRSQR